MRSQDVDEYNKAIEVNADYEDAIAYAIKHIKEPVRELGEIRTIIF